MRVLIVENIRRRLANRDVVNTISFDASTQEIIGLIGPNGAGKTTTLRLLAGYLKLDAGQIHISGIDLQAHPEAAKACIGYLPEKNTLYQDMRVLDFLTFVGQIHGLTGKRLVHALSRVVELTALQNVLNETIAYLSKGFRRRVGLAGCLIHQPRLLILDEPLDGLDPNQKRDMRKRLRDIAETTAIILSTHLLEDVQDGCDRILVMHNGQIVADDRKDALLNAQPVNAHLRGSSSLDSLFASLTAA